VVKRKKLLRPLMPLLRPLKLPLRPLKLLLLLLKLPLRPLKLLLRPLRLKLLRPLRLKLQSNQFTLMLKKPAQAGFFILWFLQKYPRPSSFCQQFPLCTGCIALSGPFTSKTLLPPEVWR